MVQNGSKISVEAFLGALLGVSGKALGAILETHGAPQRLLERSWTAPWTLLAAFEDPAANFMKIIDFSMFFDGFQ